MTDHKPFTAEQLDRIETASFFAQSSEEHEVTLRLIAQAREEIRLREELAHLAWKWLREHGDSYDQSKNECHMQLLTAIGYFGRDADPAARAKRELGEWLVEDQCRAFAIEYTGSAEGGFIYGCMLWREYDRGLDAPDVEQWADTEHEAITAALRAAKGEKP